MKKLLYIIITFMFVSNVYSQDKPVEWEMKIRSMCSSLGVDIGDHYYEYDAEQKEERQFKEALNLAKLYHYMDCTNYMQLYYERYGDEIH